MTCLPQQKMDAQFEEVCMAECVSQVASSFAMCSCYIGLILLATAGDDSQLTGMEGCGRMGQMR